MAHNPFQDVHSYLMTKNRQKNPTTRVFLTVLFSLGPLGFEQSTSRIFFSLEVKKTYFGLFVSGNVTCK